MNTQRLKVVIDGQEFLVNGKMEIFHNTGEEGPDGAERLVARYNVKDDKFEIAENSTGKGATGKLEAAEADKPAVIASSGRTTRVSRTTAAQPAPQPAQPAPPAPLHNMPDAPATPDV